MPRPQTFRFQLGDNILSSLRPFAARHADLRSTEFTIQWEWWCKTNEVLIEAETVRLRKMGYDNDVLTKLYRAARYYFKNCPPRLEPRRRINRCVYMTLAPQVLQAIDAHLRTFVSPDSAKPAALYAHFLATNTALVPLLATEIERMRMQGGFDDAKALAKIKKTYKNRYFLMTQATARSLASDNRSAPLKLNSAIMSVTHGP
jgi:hypothetical protein